MAFRVHYRSVSWTVAPLLVVLTACLQDPARSPARAAPSLPSADEAPPAPEATDAVVEFAALFEPRVVDRSVVPAGRLPDGLMNRVLLGPNLVFEASRHSLNEPATTGPAAPPPAAPQQGNALGEPVDIELSSHLMRYLVEHGSTLLAPAIARRFSDARSGKDATADVAGTWVERLLLQHQQRATDPQSARGEPLPTVALAVRRLGTARRIIDAVVSTNGAHLDYHPRRSPTEPSKCPTEKLEVPVVAFSAELLDLRDGRIIARIDDERVIGAPATKHTIKATRVTRDEAAFAARDRYEQYRREAARAQEAPPPQEASATGLFATRAEAERARSGAPTPPTTIGPAPPLPTGPYWKSDSVACENAREEFASLARQAEGLARAELKPTLTAMFEARLKPLLGPSTAGRSPATESSSTPAKAPTKGWTPPAPKP